MMQLIWLPTPPKNRISGFSPSVTVSELDDLVNGKNPVFVDVRDVFAFQKSHIKGAVHVPLEVLPQQMNTIPAGHPVIVYDETGKKGHQALRTLLGAGFKEVTNISGGHTSLQRQARTIGFKHLKNRSITCCAKNFGGRSFERSGKKLKKKLTMIIHPLLLMCGLHMNFNRVLTREQ